MNNLVVFKTNSFPTFSETFIVTNIVAAINAGYKVDIIVDNINHDENTSQPELLVKYGLLDRVSKFEQPKGKIDRKLKAICLLLNPIILYYFIKYYRFKISMSLDYVFLLNFYWKFRNALAFHVHFATAIYPLFELKEIGFIKSKLIVTFHGYDEHSMPLGEPLNNIIINFNKHVSLITTNTQYLKNKLINRGFFRDKIRVVPLGINNVFFINDDQKDFKNDCFKMITVGRFVEIKGQSYGIKVVRLLKDRGYKIIYTLVGYGEEFDALQDLVSELNLEEEVIFSGSKKQAEIKALLKEHQLFLMTSTSDKTERCETFGVVSLEAQSMGLPVVGFKSGGFPETLIEGETGITVEDKNCDEMANAVELMINDKEKRMKMSTAAQKHILITYTFEKTTQQYLKLYKK